jgi:hypothetical protein
MRPPWNVQPKPGEEYEERHCCQEQRRCFEIVFGWHRHPPDMGDGQANRQTAKTGLLGRVTKSE